MKFRIGDIVRFKDESGEGRITAILGGGMVMVLVDGIDIPMESKRLVLKVLDESDHGKLPLHVIMSKSDLPKPARIDTARRGSPSREIDLHIGQLVGNHREMSNGEMLNIQVNHFHYWMNKAITDRFEKIIFIHGVGTGVLKQEIRRLLASYPGISYHDASYKRYGFGATEVLFR